MDPAVAVGAVGVAVPGVRLAGGAGEPVGFAAGAVTDDIDPTNIMGSAFQPLVSLAVALILFDSGIELGLRRLGRSTRRVVVRLIVLGVAITWAIAASSAVLLLGMSSDAAVMLGAILVVSGPTVSGPQQRDADGPTMAGTKKRW